MAPSTQNLVSVLSLTLGPGASGSALHGLLVAGTGVAPSQVLCDRASPIKVTGADAARVYFTNTDASAPATATFRVELDHSVLVTGAPPLYWRGYLGPSTLPPSGPAGGDLSGTYPDPTVAAIEGIPIEAGGPANGDALLYNSMTGEWEHAPITFSGGPPTGPAGGDLGGLYPDPAVVGFAGNPIDTGAPAAGDVWRFDGATWQHVPQTSITSAAAYGQFYSNDDQIVADGASGISTFYFESGSGAGVSCVAAPGPPGTPKTRLTVAAAGVYALTISPQFYKAPGSGGGVADVVFWLRKNGNDVLESASFTAVKNGEHSLPFVEIILPLAAGDYVEWVAHSNLAAVSLEQEPAAPNPAYPALTRPAAPAVIAGVKRIGV